MQVQVPQRTVTSGAAAQVVSSSPNQGPSPQTGMQNTLEPSQGGDIAMHQQQQ